MAETITLDPAAVATNRTALDITPWIDAEGVDYGDAAIEAYMSDSSRGSVPVDFRVPNRTVSIPLNLRAVGATSFDTIRQQIQAKAGLFQREGGWLSRQTSIGTVYADVVNATLKLSGDWFQANRSFDANAVLTLECLPDWYGDEITLDDIVETTLPEIVSTLKLSAATANVKGDYPGRVRLVVDNDQAGTTQRGLLWGFRSRYYSSATTAALRYEAEALTALDTAASTALAGASGGNAMRHNNLSSSWTGVLSTQATGGGAHMTHVGTYRVWARVYTTSTTTVQVRFLWDVGDFTYATENDAYTIPAASNFYLADLGEMRLDQALQGTHRWLGVLQAKGANGGENVYVDRLWFQPVDEAAGRLVASSAPSEVMSYSARDEFNQTSGNLTGKTLPVGGTWTFVTGGDTDDFTLNTTSRWAERATTSDTASRLVYAASMTNAAAVAATVDVRYDGFSSGVISSYLIFRLVDASNYAYVRIETQGQLSVVKVIAGAPTTLASGFISDQWRSGLWYTLSVVADADGQVTAAFGQQGGASALKTLTVIDTALATGGTLATGKAGIGDYSLEGTAITRKYDNFAAWVPTPDAVMYASRSCEIRWDGMIRQDSAGAAWGPVSTVVGDLARVPPSGIEGRPVELFVKPSRGNLDTGADAGIDDVSARAYYRPSWLVVPGS